MKLPRLFVFGWAAATMLTANTTNATVIAETGFQQLYQLNAPNTANYNNSAPAYSVDNSGSIADNSFSRVAYYLELQTSGGSLDWVWVSFDTPSTVASNLGVPGNAGSAQTFDLQVLNMNVFSNVTSITTGTGITTGNIEFWSSNYHTGANSVYDFDDTGFGGGNGYGSMQVHNYGAGETLLAYNRWGNSGGELGIGNRSTGHPDWTFAANASTYTVKNLEVWVGDATVVPEPSSILLLALGLGGMVGARRVQQRKCGSVKVIAV